jgi:NhaA family Na+:H+ antiporter
LKQDAVAACILMAAAAAALILANTPGREWYDALWKVDFGVELGPFGVRQSLHHWINDGLMAIFFFTVGLEIKREVLVGELASFRKALLPAVAALGGMIFPALIYAALNADKVTSHGWGIPMATDIAFATGALALLGGRVPPTLSVFLVALAIVDDLGSVVVIAVFYTESIAIRPLFVGAGLILVSFGLNRLGVRYTVPYVIIGAIVWWEFLQSGVHATIAGVLLAFTIPPNARYETPYFAGRMKELLLRFTRAEDYVNPLLVNARQQSLIRAILKECHHVEAPLQRIEHALHPLCVFLILPVFAFSNCGVALDLFSIGHVLTQPVALGVYLGLVLGKQIGVTLCSWVAVRMRWADLPKDVTWAHVYGLSWLAGIGFTMSLFVSELAFSGRAHGSRVLDTGLGHLDEAKIAIFSASITAGIAGYAFLRFTGRGKVFEAASSAH